MKKQQTLRCYIVVHMPLVLLHLLIEEKALSKFLDNQVYYLNQLYNNIEDQKRFMIRSYNDQANILIKAFLWCDVPERPIYWKNLHEKLNAICHV